MQLNILFCFMLLLVCQCVNAQITITGKITEKSDHKSIIAANVSIPGLKRHAITDESGIYKLKNLPVGKFLIQISYTGYTTILDTIVVAENAVHNFVMEPSTSKLKEVVVTETAKGGYRNKTAAIGPLGNVSLKDIPYSINVTSGDLIENRNAHTLADALQTNPTAVVLMVSNTYSSLSRMMIRGFTAADQNELRDGLTDRSFTLPPIENVERIEVTNGLSAFLYGFSQAGGVVNFISKQPTPSPMASIAIGQYGGGINYVHADLGGHVDTSGRLGYRFNVYREDGNTYIQNGKQTRTLLSGVLDYKILPGTHLKADIFQQDYNVQGLQTYFLLPTGSTIVPAAFDASKQYGQPWTYNESTKTLMGLNLDSKLSDVFHLRAAYRYGTMWRKYSYVANALLDNDGNYRETYWDSPRQYEKTNSEYVLMDANFHSGPLFHHLTFGYNGTGYSYQRGADISQVLGNSNINSIASYAIPSYATVLTTTQTQTFTSFMVSDRVELSKSWAALLGLNEARLHQTARGINTGISTSNFTQSKLTPSFGLLYKPIANKTTYASYMQGLVAGGTAPACCRV
jgi:iron complex outermembrane receptor protein